MITKYKKNRTADLVSRLLLGLNLLCCQCTRTSLPMNMKHFCSPNTIFNDSQDDTSSDECTDSDTSLDNTDCIEKVQISPDYFLSFGSISYNIGEKLRKLYDEKKETGDITWPQSGLDNL